MEWKGSSWGRGRLCLESRRLLSLLPEVELTLSSQGSLSTARIYWFIACPALFHSRLFTGMPPATGGEPLKARARSQSSLSPQHLDMAGHIVISQHTVLTVKVGMFPPSMLKNKVIFYCLIWRFCPLYKRWRALALLSFRMIYSFFFFCNLKF